MPELEKRIEAWRQDLLQAGLRRPEVLDELEIHLREQTAWLVRAGMSEETAFAAAVLRLGTPGAMQCEFNKLNPASKTPVVAGSVVWSGAVIFVAVVVMREMPGWPADLLLPGHALSLTAGYLAAFVAGGLGIYYVCLRLFDNLTLRREESLARAIFLFNCLAVGLVSTGMVLGIFWAKQNGGHFLGVDARVIGTICVWSWLVMAPILQRRVRVGERSVFLLSIMGSLMVTLSWFGAGIMATALKRSIPGNYWPLWTFIGLQLVFLMLGLLPANSLRLKSS